MLDFSHPVLANDLDYIKGNVTFSDLIIEDNVVKIEEIAVSNVNINKMIADKALYLSIYIENKAAFFSKPFKYNSLKNIEFEIKNSFPEGKYNVEILIQASKPFEFNLPDDFHEDFKDVSFNINKSDVIVYVGTAQFNIDKDYNSFNEPDTFFDFIGTDREDLKNRFRIDAGLGSDNIKIYYNSDNKPDMNNIMRFDAQFTYVTYIIPSLIVAIQEIQKLERDDLLPYIESEKGWVFALYQLCEKYNLVLSELMFSEVDDIKTNPEIIAQKICQDPILKVSETLKNLEL